ncbi:MAG TPA: hypothetical protein VFP55_00685 [Solirubrobacteraceae bacterium]|nr:hypothetical protein [Solirubrobacteraceae bacterium]
MGLVRLLPALAAITLAVGACGGGTHRTAPPKPAGHRATTTARTAPHPPPGFAGRLLEDNELKGFLIGNITVYTTPSEFVSSEQLSPAEAAVETRMLARNGFRGTAEETLDDRGVAGLSLAARFGSPAAARAALRYYVAKFRRLGGSAAEFALFPVAAVPGAVGFRLGSAGGAGSNIAFADGDYYYLLGEEGSGPAIQGGLGAAAGSLYRRVRG